jgi:hypothetical protein
MENIIANLSLVLIPLAIFDVVMRGVALWQAAQNKQRNWFIALLIVNSLGILPLVYLKFFQKK